jgi:hypothetical protein
MPNITLYLDNETYAKFVVSKNQKAIKDKCVEQIKSEVCK